MGRIIPHIMEDKKCLKPPTIYIYIILYIYHINISLLIHTNVSKRIRSNNGIITCSDCASTPAGTEVLRHRRSSPGPAGSVNPRPPMLVDEIGPEMG
jgi:hypothetical protein